MSTYSKLRAAEERAELAEAKLAAVRERVAKDANRREPEDLPGDPQRAYELGRKHLATGVLHVVDGEDG